MSMADRSAERNPLDLLAEEFVARYRGGERPAVAEYVEGHPELAEQIQELFPALLMMEQIKTAEGNLAPKPPGGQLPLPSSPFPIERLGDFRILRVLGQGGMGIVYEAVQESLGRHVALKVLPPHGRLDPTQLGRFRREARSAAGLHHTNIVPVFAVGEQDGVPYYAMQFIQGQGIDAILDELRRLQHGGTAAGDAPRPGPNRERDPGQPRCSPVSPVPPALSGDRAALTGTIAQALLSGRFAVSAEHEPDRPATCATSKVDPAAPASTETTGAESIPTEDAMALLAPERSDLISQPGATYFRTVARIGAQTADALAYAHAQGICHRDIKPSNLLLDGCGIVWIADFGLAKAEIGDAEGLTHTGDVVGTLRYMAPERFNGRADARSDVYALGVTLYEMLTLRPAFVESDRLKLIDRISGGAVPRPRSIDPRIPSDLETIVLKAMARESAERYLSARALAEDLERFLADRTILARRSSARERTWRWCHRNPALAAVTGLAASLTVLVAIVSTVAALVSIRQLDRTTKAERQAELALGKSTTAERQARLALGKSLLSEGAALQRTGLIGQRFDSLNRLAEAAKVLSGDREGQDRLPEIRIRAIAALGLTDMQVLRQRDHGDIYSFSVDTALERYAVAERSGTVVVHRFDDHRELVRLPAPDERSFWHAATMFSPDGELLVAVYVGSAGGGDLLRVWHLGRRELLASLRNRGGGAFYGGAFSPDSRRFLFSPLEGGIGVWDRGERRVVRRLLLDFAPHYLAIDPEGRRLAVNNADAPARVAILELESGRVLADWRSKVGNTNLAWSADGQLLAIGSGSDSRVYVWNVRLGELASVLQGYTSYIINAQFAHAGHLLATTSWEGTTRLWDAASGELLATASGQEIGFAADDRRLAYQLGTTVGVWGVASGDECRTLHPAMLGNRSERRDATAVFSGEFSPDGRLLATGDRDGVRLWEADTGREVAHLKDRTCEDVCFHPDGKTLITSGRWGLYRWPIGPDPDRGAGSVRVGPPELLREGTSHEWNRAAWLPDFRTLALIDNSNARVLLVDSSHPHPAWSRAAALDSGENRRMTSVAVSPDGRWLAVGGWKEAAVRVWDLRRRRLERLLRPNDILGAASFFVGFSPDGRWLISSTSSVSDRQYHFWHTGTWELGRRIDTGHRGAWFRPVFTGDGRLMALGIAADQVLLADAATGREVVRLTTLQPVGPTPLAFSPDGTKLAASTAQKTVLVWDLRRIRDHLVPLGLDWDAPPYPSSTASAAGAAAGVIPLPRTVRVVGEILEPQARRKAERALMDRRLGANPDDAEALIHRGWLSLTERRLPEAIADLDHLRRCQTDDPDVDRLLGQAYLDAGNLTGALACSSRVLERVPEDHDTRFERGLLALAAGLTQQADDDFNLVLAGDPTRDLARYHRARALNRLGRYREALFDLDSLISNNPKDFMLYQLRGTAHEALGEHEPARLDRVKACSLLPPNPDHLNSQAWGLVTGSLVKRDPERALALARQAVRLAPNEWLYLNTLGLVLYRAGRSLEAVDVLERSLAAGRGELDALDLFFLAMAHHDLGHPGQALTCFDRAVQWWEGHKKPGPQYVQELIAFRAEAEALLAVPGGDLPADVFARP
ncbi:MAG: protein kinase domain-containing protein [Isosphaeraceae bacterium]